MVSDAASHGLKVDVAVREHGVFAFGAFRLDPVRRSLTHAGANVALTARLFDLLLYLVENSTRLVERDELANAIWANRVVADGNLQKAVSLLRKALQELEPAATFIITVPARGFRIAVPVTFEPGPVGDLPAVDPGNPRPSAVTPLWPGKAALIVSLQAVALAAVALALWRPAPGPAEPPPFNPPPHSVAVMPFENFSSDPGQHSDNLGCMQAPLSGTSCPRGGAPSAAPGTVAGLVAGARGRKGQRALRY